MRRTRSGQRRRWRSSGICRVIFACSQQLGAAMTWQRSGASCLFPTLNVRITTLLREKKPSSAQKKFVRGGYTLQESQARVIFRRSAVKVSDALRFWPAIPLSCIASEDMRGTIVSSCLAGTTVAMMVRLARRMWIGRVYVSQAFWGTSKVDAKRGTARGLKCEVARTTINYSYTSLELSYYPQYLQSILHVLYRHVPEETCGSL